MIFLITFICGLVYEVTSVYWVLSTEKLQPIKAALCGLIQVLVMLTGIGESIKDVRVAACYAIGYSLGSAVGILIEKRRIRSNQPLLVVKG